MSLQLLQESRYKHLIKVDPETGCWIWLGARNKKGYGLLSIHCGNVKLQERAHRYFYKQKYGYIPPSLQLDHIVCDNTSCCNPDHVKPATNWENTRRSVTNPIAINARKTHCKRGHEFTPENTYYRIRERNCKICRRENNREYDKRRQKWRVS